VSANDSPRTLLSFLQAIRAQPGFWFKVIALGAFGASVVIKSGFVVAVAILVGCIIVGVLIGYPIYRRTGRVPP
jgi:hypothetical protein